MGDQSGTGGTDQGGSGQTATGSLTGRKGGADDHLSGDGNADEPHSGSCRTAWKNTDSLVTASTAATGHAVNSAGVSLTIKGQTKRSRGETATQRGAEQTQAPQKV